MRDNRIMDTRDAVMLAPAPKVGPTVGRPHAGQIQRVSARQSRDGTTKFIVELGDGQQAEAAHFFISGRLRPHIACVSTQVGCPVACNFCATKNERFNRNLTASEILFQIRTVFDPLVQRTIDEGLFEVSFMGMGEPLMNLDNVVRSIKYIGTAYPGMTRVSVSTVGPAGRISRFARMLPSSPHTHLQLSLHATNDDIRKRLIPHLNGPIHRLLDAGRRFADTTGDHVCLNYLLLPGVNDSDDDVAWLIGNVNPEAFYIKISQLNLVPRLPRWMAVPSVDALQRFAKLLREAGLSCQVFVGDGLDIAASCGQMAATPRQLPLQPGVAE